MWPLSQFMQQVLDLMQESAVTVPLPSALPHWPTMSLALHSPLKNHTDSLSHVLPDLIHTHSFKQIHGTQDIIPKELLKDIPFVHRKKAFMKAFDIFQNVLIQNTTKILSKKKTSCSQILDWQDLCVHPLCDCERIQSTVAASNPFYALSLVFIPNPVPPVSVLLTQAHLSLNSNNFDSISCRCVCHGSGFSLICPLEWDGPSTPHWSPPPALPKPHLSNGPRALRVYYTLSIEEILRFIDKYILCVTSHQFGFSQLLLLPQLVGNSMLLPPDTHLRPPDTYLRPPDTHLQPPDTY